MLIYLQPHDYWHVVAGARRAATGSSISTSCIIRTPDEAAQHLPKDAARCAILGEAASGAGDFVPEQSAAQCSTTWTTTARSRRRTRSR